MRPDNAFTTPEQRFFLPNGLEAECHKSFDLSSQPQTEMLGGEVGYVVIENEEGREVAAQSGMFHNLQPGSVVKKIITLGVAGNETTFPGKPWLHTDGSDGTNDQRWLDDPVDAYEPQEGDLLVLEVNRGSHMPRDAKLKEQIDENGVLLWPAGKKLPFSDGEVEGDYTTRDVSYSLGGIITPELKFVGWKDEMSRNARYLVDLVVASANMDNELERSVLVQSIPREYSLIGMLSGNRAAMSYLQYFESKTGRSYIPEEDPNSRTREFAPMTDVQRSRYDLVFEALNASIRLRKN